MIRFSTIFILLSVNVVFGQQTAADSILNLCIGKDDLVDKVISNRSEYRLQFILTELKDDSILSNTIDGTSGEYYYPASLVKLPVVLATLEKMKRENISLNDYIRLDKGLPVGNSRFISLTQSHKLTFSQLIEEILVVSDNDYFNVLYHFVTPEELNNSLHEKGFEKTLIYRCFSGCSKEDQLKTVGAKVYDENDSLIYQQEATSMSWSEIADQFATGDDKYIGKRIVKGGDIINTPYNFNYNLEFPLTELHEVLISLVMDDSANKHGKWNLRLEDRAFVLDNMRKFPRELENSKYQNQNKYPDNAFKIIAFGDPKLDNSRYKTYSKIGYSYGFISESAFVTDTVTGNSYFLTISMYVNKNSTINDSRYEYKTVATPFMGRFTHILFDVLNEKSPDN